MSRLNADRRDNLAGRDSHGSRYRLENPRRAGCGSHLAGDSPVDHRHAHNRVGFGRERSARRDSRASNAPPAVDRSVALGPPAAGRRWDLQCYSAYEPCRLRFGRNPYLHRAPSRAMRPAQWCKAALWVLNIATFGFLLNEQSLPADEQSTEPRVPHEFGLG